MTSPSYSYQTTKSSIPHHTLTKSLSLNQTHSDYFEFECPSPLMRPITPLSTRPPAMKLTPRKSIKNLFKSKSKESENINIPKSKWRPTLQYVYDDSELLSALIAFMRKQYNEENILFLITIRNLNNQIDALLSTNIKMINFEIISIFDEYIIHNAPKQVNLSYNCFNEVMTLKQTFVTFDLNDKKCMFNNCVIEVERLINTSILSGFYNSDAFNLIAWSRPVPPPIFIDIKTDESYLSASELMLSNTGSSSVDEYEMATPQYQNTPYHHECVDFDIQSDLGTPEAIGKYMISSKGFLDGYHEWTIKITNMTEYRQEIGVVSSIDNHIKMSRFGIARTPLFSARVVYGCNNLNGFYYASYGRGKSGNEKRCYKDLSRLDVHQNGWANGVIKVCLNLNKGNIKFYLNGQKVRRTLSVEKGIQYYPFVSFT